MIAAFAFARLLAWILGDRGDAWFAMYIYVGFLPFMWFARKRRVINGDLWDFLAGGVGLVAILRVLPVVEAKWGDTAAIPFVGVSALCFGWIYRGIRKRLALKGTATESDPKGSGGQVE